LELLVPPEASATGTLTDTLGGSIASSPAAAALHLRRLATLGGYGDGRELQGLIVTGWARFNHLLSLCEVLPASLPALACCLSVHAFAAAAVGAAPAFPPQLAAVLDGAPDALAVPSLSTATSGAVQAVVARVWNRQLATMHAHHSSSGLIASATGQRNGSGGWKVGDWLDELLAEAAAGVGTAGRAAAPLTSPPSIPVMPWPDLRLYL